MKINLFLIIALFFCFETYATGDQPYKKIHSSNVNSDDIIMLGSPDKNYVEITKGYSKLKTISAGGSIVEVFKKENNYLVFNIQKEKYGWISFEGNEEKLASVIRELVVNIYNI